MNTNQIKLLTNLAKKIENEKKDKDTAFASLHAANILTKKGNFSKHYQHLGKAVMKNKKG